MNRDLDHYRALNYPMEIVREEGGIFASHPDLDGCFAQGDTVEAAVANLDAARELWLKVRIEDHLPIEEPVEESKCNGRISFRTSRDVHARAIKASRRQQISLNQLLNNALADHLAGELISSYVAKQIDEAVSKISASYWAWGQVRRPTTTHLRDASLAPPQEIFGSDWRAPARSLSA